MKPKQQTHSENLKRTMAKRAPGKGREHKKASHGVVKSNALESVCSNRDVYKAICAQREGGST